MRLGLCLPGCCCFACTVGGLRLPGWQAEGAPVPWGSKEPGNRALPTRAAVLWPEP